MPIAIVTGGSSGLGKAIAAAMRQENFETINWSLETGVDVGYMPSVVQAFCALPTIEHPLTLVNCAGTNSPRKFENLTFSGVRNAFDVNALGIFNTTKVLLKPLRNGTVCNIISNASHVPMTHSLAYNASKAAAAMMTRQMAKEFIKSHNITVFGVSPNKMYGTAMSKEVDAQCAMLKGMTDRQAHEYQLSKMITETETNPDDVAEFVAFLLSNKRRHQALAGCIMEYGA